jgi:hypothetical protein
MARPNRKLGISEAVGPNGALMTVKARNGDALAKLKHSLITGAHGRRTKR